jgi:hypothetical protein
MTAIVCDSVPRPMNVEARTRIERLHKQEDEASVGLDDNGGRPDIDINIDKWSRCHSISSHAPATARHYLVQLKDTSKTVGLAITNSEWAVIERCHE